MTEDRFYLGVVLPIIVGLIIGLLLLLYGRLFDPKNEIIYSMIAYLVTTIIMALTFLINMILVGCRRRKMR